MRSTIRSDGWPPITPARWMKKPLNWETRRHQPARLRRSLRLSQNQGLIQAYVMSDIDENL
ncbi:hypothetical protein M8494_15450 [Serratia ureilytica]